MSPRYLNGLKAVAQIRVSSDRQVLNTSLDHQETEIVTHAYKNGYELLKIFREEGDSGAALFKRTDLQAALDFCSDKSNQVDIFVTYKIDRFTRDIYDFTWFIKKLEELKIPLISVTEDYDIHSIEGEFTRNLFALLADKDRKDILRKMGNGHVDTWKQGYKPGSVPTGYKKEDIYSEKCRDVVKDGDRYNLVKLGWEMLLSDQFTLIQIVNKWNDLGLTTRATAKRPSRKINKQTASNIFRNKFYAGYVEAHNKRSKYAIFDVEARQGRHYEIRMIDIEDWFRAQDILNKKAMSKYIKHDSANPNYLLVKLLRCSNCGSIMTASENKKKNKSYYRCYNRVCNQHQSVNTDRAEKAFMKYLMQLQPDPLFVKGFKRFLEIIYKSDTQEQVNIAKQYEDSIQRDETKIKKIKELAEMGFYDDPMEAKNKVEDLTSNIATLKYKQQQALTPSDDMNKIIETNLNLLQQLPDLWKRLTPQNRVRFHRKIFPEGVTYSNGIVSNRKISPAFEYIWNVQKSSKDWWGNVDVIATKQDEVKPSQSGVENLREIYVLVRDVEKWDGNSEDMKKIVS